MSAALNLPHRLTVAEFLAWNPPEELAELRWELVDGEPVCMAPPSVDHGAIQAQTAYLITSWLARHRPGCRVITGPGVIPKVRSGMNYRIPDLAVSCAPFKPAQALLDATVLIEILSANNENKTRADVWAYCTLPSVQEIVLLSTSGIAAELLRRSAEGAWPAEPELLAAGDDLHLASLGYREPLTAHYATSSLGS